MVESKINCVGVLEADFCFTISSMLLALLPKRKIFFNSGFIFSSNRNFILIKFNS
jgi:hypothetical protein